MKLNDEQKELILEFYKYFVGMRELSTWPTQIEIAFPELFEEPFKDGHWIQHKTSKAGKFLIKYQEENIGTGMIGFNRNGEWGEKIDYTGRKGYFQENYRKATKEEVEAALIAEAKIRGVWNVPILDVYGDICGYRKHSELYGEAADRLWSNYGAVYLNGEWVAPIKTITKQEAEKQLKAIIV